VTITQRLTMTRPCKGTVSCKQAPHLR